MTKKNYAQLEQRIISLFNENRTFQRDGKTYHLHVACKPTTSAGECKTDVYVKAEEQHSGDILELKISVKSRNSSEFQENKVTAERAEAYFGENWSSIIQETSQNLAKDFEDKALIHLTGKYPVKANSITLGWKLEIADRPRKLSAPLALNVQEVKDYVYKGTNQPENKKNAFVNGSIVLDSGVADFIIYTELSELMCLTDVLDKLEFIDNKDFPRQYLIFTANNYRTDKARNPSDGQRSLAVYIDWKVENNKLCHEIIYDKPLSYQGQNHIQPRVQAALREFGLIHPHQLTITADNLEQPSILYP